MKRVSKFFIIIIVVVLNFFWACEREQNPISINTLNNYRLNIGNSFLKINDSIKVFITIDNNIESDFLYQWSANIGKIKGSGNQVEYIAPENTGTAKIFVSIQDLNSNYIILSDSIVIFKQFIILKADDMYWDIKNTISENWLRFVDMIFQKGIKASLGVIGNSLEHATNDYYVILKFLDNSGHFELWNHGYNHILNQINENGVNYCEFKNTSYLYQQQNLERTQFLANTKLQISFRTFGAPGNAYDESTLKVIDENEEILIWFFGNPKSKKLVLKRFGEIEFPTFNSNFNKFVEIYDTGRDNLVLQIHPDKWDDSRFAEFEKVVDFLIENQSTFITPIEYYYYLKSKM